MVYATLVVEDVLQAAAAQKVIQARNLSLRVPRTLGLQGSGFIDRNLDRFAQAGAYGIYIVIKDLDRHPCPPALARRLLERPPPAGLLLSIAVKEVEAWLLADSTSFRRYFGVGKMEGAPETLDDPKGYIISLARRSRRREIRENIIPTGTAKVGKLYDATLLDFIHGHWKVDRARRRSPSLDRFVERVSLLAARA